MFECSEEFLRAPGNESDGEASVQSSPEVLRLSEPPPSELPPTPAIEQYVYSRVDLFGASLFEKEAMEMGYSAEVEALTEATYKKYTGALEASLDDFVRGLFWEACWRIALKFHSLDGYFNMYFQYKKDPVRRQYLNQLESIVLDRLDWTLPLEEANRSLPIVLRRHVDKISSMSDAQQKIVKSLRENDTSQEVLRNSCIVQLALDRLRDVRAMELVLVEDKVDRQEQVAVRTRLDRLLNESHEELQRRAERMVKKRPSRMIS